MRKDYYSILGVSQDADQDEIKRAFRRLARETHPDANPGDPSADARFREVAEAYEVLSDPDRRRAFDRGETIDLGDLLVGGFDDLLRSVFGTGGPFGFGGQRRPARGRDVAVEVRIGLADAAFGTTSELKFRALSTCRQCAGSGAAPGSLVKTCSRCGGTGSMQVARRSIFGQMMTLTTCNLCQGSGRIVAEPCDVCGGRGVVREERTVSVEIPQGVSTGTRLRLAGRGEAAPRGAPAGDLYVEIRVQPDPRFVREGDDLTCTVPIDIAQAALGTEVSVPLIEGGSMNLRIPPGTQPGQTIPIPGEGMGRLGRRGRGTLNVVVEVVVPERLSKEEERVLREFGELRGDAVRAKRRFW
ncbi:chaperone protein DnaJ [bacterium BMS3Abin02]|nr:chaperone protein DnaJ [bacterium BMS3Abin02]GBE21352.1 chaperone protein DnaJ [bacterium BMS3Bbin01]HDL49239.1 molecular chaperone DnaJ [Actinomycetota bacterium]